MRVKQCIFTTQKYMGMVSTYIPPIYGLYADDWGMVQMTWFYSHDCNVSRLSIYPEVLTLERALCDPLLAMLSTKARWQIWGDLKKKVDLQSSPWASFETKSWSSMTTG